MTEGVIKPKRDFEPPEVTAEGPKLSYKDFRQFLDEAGGAKLSEHDKRTLLDCLDPAGTGSDRLQLICSQDSTLFVNVFG